MDSNFDWVVEENYLNRTLYKIASGHFIEVSIRESSICNHRYMKYTLYIDRQPIYWDHTEWPYGRSAASGTEKFRGVVRWWLTQLKDLDIYEDFLDSNW